MGYQEVHGGLGGAGSSSIRQRRIQKSLLHLWWAFHSTSMNGFAGCFLDRIGTGSLGMGAFIDQMRIWCLQRHGFSFVCIEQGAAQKDNWTVTGSREGSQPKSLRALICSWKSRILASVTGSWLTWSPRIFPSCFNGQSQKPQR